MCLRGVGEEIGTIGATGSTDRCQGVELCNARVDVVFELGV
jgi:hypothetical protein